MAPALAVMSKLIITQNGRDKIYEILDDEFTIGAGPEADLVLEDDRLAPAHLRVKKTPAGFRIVDLETKHGTRVSGRPINNHLLADGDTIEVGDVVLTYSGYGPAPTAPKDETSIESERSARRPITSRPVLRPRGFGDRIGVGGRTAVLIGLVVFGGAIASFVYEQSIGPSAVLRERLAAARRSVENVTAPSLADAFEKVEAVERIATSEPERYEISGLRKRLTTFRDALARTDRIAEARAQYAKIAAARAEKADGDAQVAQLAREYIRNFDDLELSEEIDVRRLIAAIERAPRGSDAAISRILHEAGDFLRAREFRKAMAILDRADPTARAAYGDQIRDAEKKILDDSRLAAAERLSAVESALRAKDIPAADREIGGMLEKFVWSSMDDVILASRAGPETPERADAVQRLSAALAARRGR